MSTKPKFLQWLKWIICGIPVVMIIGTSFLPLQIRGQQFLILALIIWVQVFLIFEVFGIGK